MSRRSGVLGGAVLMAVATSPAVVRADDSALAALLDEPIVSTASKSAGAEHEAPATSYVISSDELRAYGIKSLDEAINFLSLGMVTQNPLHAVDLGARGVLLTADFGNHVLLLVNGHALNEPWDGTAYFERGAAIPFELIDHVEIVLGAGSVLYGSHAMLGVINIITKSATDYNGVRLVAESDIATSLRGAVGYGSKFRLLGKDAELTTQLEYYTQRGPDFTFGPQRYGADTVTNAPKNFGAHSLGPGVWGGTVRNEYYTQVPAGYARVVWGDFALDVRAAMFKRATPYTNLFNLYAGDFDDPNTFERDRWLSVDLKHTAALSKLVELRSRVYTDSYDYRQQYYSSAAMDCAAHQNAGCTYTEVGLSRWMGLEEQLAFDWLSNRRLTTLLGADAQGRYVGMQVDYKDIVTGFNPGTVGPARRYEGAIGIYAQQTARPLPWLDFNAGVRLDADDRYGSAVSPRGVVAANPWKGGTVKAIYSEAYRAPTLLETSYTDATTQIAAPGLRPERVRSEELSFEHRAGSMRVLFGVFASQWTDMVKVQQLDATALAAAIQNGLLPAGTPSGVQDQNVGRIEDVGFNGAFDGSLLEGRLRYAINVTGAKARRTTPDAASLPLPVAPQMFGNGRVSYRFAEPLPTVALAASVVAPRPADRAFDGGFTPTPYAPTQAQIRGTLSGPIRLLPGLTYRLIADYAFSSVSPYVAGPAQAARPDIPSAQLAPVDRFRTTIGLQYVSR